MSSNPERELLYLNALNAISVLGARKIATLAGYFGSAESAWHAPAEDYTRAVELEGQLETVKQEKSGIDPEKEWDKLLTKKIKCTSPHSPDYPDLLREMNFPPPVLYYRGSLEQINKPAVAIVGSRRCTFYGKEVAGKLASELAAAGVGVISGMALGVDTAAHQGALDNGGYSAAVLGCGLDRCYPPRNRGLMDQLIDEGAVISEFAAGMEPMAKNFPQRNRIISGLSLGTVVVEATAKSGALITAGFALEQNREVFAVPGNVGSPYSRGCHRLLKEGARLVESVQDILVELYLDSGKQLTIETIKGELSDSEKKLLGIIPYQPMHIDTIVQMSGQKAAEVGAILLSLEIKNYVAQSPGKFFCRT
jgi:DNA processing protein